MADIAYPDNQVIDNNQVLNGKYHEIRDILSGIGFDDHLKHVKTVFKRLSLEKNNQIINHAEAQNTENENELPNAGQGKFEFCWEKQLKKLDKLKKRIIKKHGDQLLEQIRELINPDALECEMSIDNIDEGILRYVLENQKFEHIILKRRSDCLIINNVNIENGEDVDMDLDASFESGDPQNRYADMNIAEAIEDVLDNQAKTNPDPIIELQLINYDPADNRYYFTMTEPSYIGNSRIVSVCITIEEVLTKEKITIESNKFEFSTKELKENSQYNITVELQNLAGYKSLDNPVYKIYTHAPSITKANTYISTLNNYKELPDEGPFVVKKLSYLTSSVKFSEKIPLKIIDLDVGGSALCLLNTGGILNWGKIIMHKDDNSPGSLPTNDINSLVVEVTGVHLPLSGCLIREISCGKNFCMALSCMGQLYSWGINSYGQLGHNDFQHRPDPSKVKSDRFYTAIRAGYENCYAEDDKGCKYVWGKGMSLKWVMSSQKINIMNNPENHQSTPRKIDFASTDRIKRVEIGSSLYVFLCDKGNLFTLGDNNFGQLGFDKPDGTELPFCDQPHKLQHEKPITDFSVGKYHVIFMDVNKDIYGFGRNMEHQLKKTDIPYYRSAVLIKENVANVNRIVAFNKTSVLRLATGKYRYLNEDMECDYLFGNIIQKSYAENLVSFD